MEELTSRLEENRQVLDDKIGVGRNYDVIARDLVIGGKAARLYVLDGYADDSTIERILSFLLQVRPEEMEDLEDMDQVISHLITFGEVDG